MSTPTQMKLLAVVSASALLLGACGSEDAAGNGPGSSGGSGAAAGAGGSGGSGGSAGGGNSAGSGNTAGALPDVSCPSDPVDGFQGSGPQPKAEPTFHSMGLYWKPSEGASDNRADVLFRRRGACDWTKSEPLWFDPNKHSGAPEHDNEYRGSLVDLLPGTKYEIRLSLESGGSYSFPAQTWDEDFPIAETITLDGQSDQPLVIDKGGDENGYVLYVAGTNGYTIDVNKAHSVSVQIDASYVILRGVTLRGASQHGIRLGAVNHVVIEDSDISDWGSVVKSVKDPKDKHYIGFGTNFTSGIYSNEETLSHIVIQRNQIHHPTHDSNSWDEFDPTEGSSSFVHPEGPQGITFVGSAGHHVIRYNHIFSDEDHKFNDGMGEYHNASYGGFPNRDSDIYANIVSNVWDDAIEAEGSGMNVRVFGNYVDHMFIAFGLASQSLGPLYLYRNVSGFAQRGTVESGEHTRGGSFGKIGSGSLEYARGQINIFHNTVLQPPSPFNSSPGGAGGVAYSTSSKKQQNIRTRNNIFHLRKSSSCAISDPNENATNDFDNDMTNGKICAASSQEPNLIVGTPKYAPGNPKNVWALDSSSPGYDQGALIPGFNHGSAGSGPDVGVFEAGAPAPGVGTKANWTSWSVWVATQAAK